MNTSMSLNFVEFINVNLKNVIREIHNIIFSICEMPLKQCSIKKTFFAFVKPDGCKFWCQMSRDKRIGEDVFN